MGHQVLEQYNPTPQILPVETDGSMAVSAFLQLHSPPIYRRCIFQTRKNYYVDLRHSVCEKEGSSLGTALFRFFIICPQRPPELTIFSLGKQTTWSCYRRGQKPTDYGACLKESCLRNCSVAHGGLISHAYPIRICTCDGAGASSNEPTISQQQYSRAMNRKKSTQPRHLKNKVQYKRAPKASP